MTDIVWTPRVSPWVGEGGHLHVLPDPDISETYTDSHVETRLTMDPVSLSLESTAEN